MAANIGPWVSENTLTVGTGVITLGGSLDKSFTTFSKAVAAGEVWYSIEDLLNGNREEGIGTFSGETQLERTTVHSTLIDGVLLLAESLPTPINLTGNAIVSCTFNTSAYTELADLIPPPVPPAVATIVLETSTNASLLPMVTTQQIPFDPVGHIGDAITVDYAGCISVNVDGVYAFTTAVQAFGLLNRGDRAIAYVGMKVNDVFVGHYSYKLLTHTTDLQMITHTDTVVLSAGSIVTFEVYRDTEYSNNISFMPVAIDNGTQGSIPMAAVKVIKL